MVYTRCFTSCQTTYDIGSKKIRKFQENLKTSRNYRLVPSFPLAMKILSVLAKSYCYFAWNLKFVSSILPRIFSGNSCLILTRSRPLQPWIFYSSKTYIAKKVLKKCCLKFSLARFFKKKIKGFTVKILQFLTFEAVS